MITLHNINAGLPPNLTWRPLSPATRAAPISQDDIMTTDRRPLQVSRSLLNGAALREWAKSQGLIVTVPDDEFHVTIAYSRTPVDWDSVGVGERRFVVQGGARWVDLLGVRGNALVLSFASPELTARWRQIRDAGASWEDPDYQPHITLAYDLPAANLLPPETLAHVAPHTGPLFFGPERLAPIGERYRK